jgi:hypothetical protein
MSEARRGEGEGGLVRDGESHLEMLQVARVSVPSRISAREVLWGACRGVLRGLFLVRAAGSLHREASSVPNGCGLVLSGPRLP